MQTAATGLYVVFQFLRTRICMIDIFHCFGPYATGHAPYHAVFSVHAITEKERKIWREIINLHSAPKIIFHVCKAVRKRERKLCDRISPCLCDMIATYRN